MLKKMCEEQPAQWDRYISPLLFACREVKQESLGFSPFEIIYGKSVRGPLTILKELWTKDVPQDEVKITYQYVIDLNKRLEETMRIAQSELRKSQKKYRHYANQKTRDRQFKVGDKVLLLLPTDNNKLLMQWKGPYDITEKVTNQDYRINMKGKSRLFHVNMLKRYIQREEGNAVDVTNAQVDKVNSGLMTQVCVAVIDEEMAEDQQDNFQRNIKVDLPNIHAQESFDDIKINPELSESQKTELRNLVTEFKDVITDIPGSTDLIEHEIRLNSNEPVRSKPYTAPYALNQCIKDEIKSMLQMGIIEPSSSPYASPVVIVKKADGSNRFCIDYRKLNRITVFDAEPIGNPDVIFTRLGKSKYFTKLDLAKGYWQIKMKDSCIPLTAFITSDGLFAFRRMPFGLVNSGATFSRMMRKLLYDLEQTEHFVDDVMEHTETWEFHLVCLRKLLSRLRGAHLTVKPSKCMFGFTFVTFLGHVVGKGILSPNPEKLTQIEQTPRPTTKKEVRSFLGLIGYYQKFIPNFSAIACPLTDLTRKGNPNIVIWEQEHENAYKALTGALSKPPVLRLPQFDQVFILRTDASNYGLGAVILQEHEEMKSPVFYASRKLKGPELHYSVIEKECFAVVWSIQKFQPYLYGREFILETDHQPLLYINRAKVTNPRIMRWALALQPYRFSVRAIKGSENLGADFLSRTLP